MRAKTAEASIPSNRLTSLDAYRGLAMFLMVGEAFHFCHLHEHSPDNRLWGWLCHHQEHVEWIGCTIHDMIQPSFSFMVGVALPFSLASRAARGQSRAASIAHAWWRAFVLIGLGIFLRSLGHSQTRFTFEDTLTQIGLGYGILFLLGLATRRIQLVALTTILVGYWLAFAVYPLPPTGLDTRTVGVPANWEHQLTGFSAHWNKNTNLAADFDRWFLNLFPREAPFEFNGGGYQTLSFIPTLGTMILGLFAGQILRSELAPYAKVRNLVAIGIAIWGLGWGIHLAGLCPIVKRIWTPAFALTSGGGCFLVLAALYTLIDIRGWRAWAFPLVVIGMNSIAIYCMSWMLEGFIAEVLQIHLGGQIFSWAGAPYEPTIRGIFVVASFWLILYWMYRRRIFLAV